MTLHPLLRIALALCPPEFRREHYAEVVRDIDAQPNHIIRLSLDLAYHGIAMRCEELVRNATFAVRTLRKAPAFTIISILAIALAIGPNVAVVSIVKAVLLQPFPFAHTERLAFVSETGEGTDFSIADGHGLAAHSQTFEHFGLSTTDTATFTQQGHSVLLNGSIVDDGYFSTLGIQPLLGRFFERADLATRNVVISERLWREYFSADPAVIGKPALFDGNFHTVIGVAPASFRDPVQHGLFDGDYWEPLDVRNPLQANNMNRWLDGWALLRPNVTTRAAQADVARVLGTIGRFDTALPLHATVIAMLPEVIGPVAPMLILLYLGVTALLVIACANVVNLTIARMSSRERELVVRSAMGATRGHLASQFCIETGMLACAGGLAGTALAWGGLRMMGNLASQALPRWQSVRIDVPIVGYTIALLFVTTIVMGLLPAFMQKRDLAVGLRSAGRSGNLSSSIARRLRVTLVVLEIALAISVVTSAGVIVRSFYALTHASIGFQPTTLSVISHVDFPASRYSTRTIRTQALDRLISSLQRIPGVFHVASAAAVPFDGNESFSRADIPQLHIRGVRVQFNVISPDYFSTLHIPILRGRAFSSSDRASSHPVAVINETFARQSFGTIDVVGQTFRPHISATGPILARTIVGVVGDTRNGFAQPAKSEMYFPHSQIAGFGELVLAVNDSSPGIANAVRGAFAQIDPLLPPPNALRYHRLLDEDDATSQAAATLFSFLAFIALALALAGIYAVTAYAAMQRRREFGIRKALGAPNSAILRDVLTGAMRQSAAGMTIGLVVFAALNHSLQSLLYAVSAFDPMTLCVVIVLVVTCTTLASLMPALRAIRTDPAVALRYE